MSKGKISVCLPVFNGSKYLTQAIESVLGQSYSNLELLIADDLSTDDSQAIAEKYARQDKRVIYWKNEINQGIFGNYNQCLKRASGELIKLFAQDDLLETTCCERLSDQLAVNKNISIVSCARAVIDEQGKETAVERFFDKTMVIPGQEMITAYANTFVYKIGTPCQVMFRKESIGSGFNTLYKLSGDIEYFLRILESDDFMYLDEVLVKFRRHAQSVTITALADLSFVFDACKLAEKYARYLVSDQTDPIMHRGLVEGLIRKVNNAIHERKIDFSQIMRKGIAGNGNSKQQLDFEKFAYQFLFYAAEAKMQMEQNYHSFKRREDTLQGELTEAKALRKQLEHEIDQLGRQLNDLQNSSSWKITQPLRWLNKSFKT